LKLAGVVLEAEEVFKPVKTKNFAKAVMVLGKLLP